MPSQYNNSNQPGFITLISQELGDAKRALLNRAPSSVRDHAWISPDATSCTIRSAPPHTSQALTQLSTKSGWLLMQHLPSHNSDSNPNSSSSSLPISCTSDNTTSGSARGPTNWKRKWCCVVPHTYLYVFDDPLLDSSHSSSSSENAPTLNDLLSCGATTQLDIELDEEGRDVVNPAKSKLKPSSIIDLECYTSVHRMQSGYILELNGTPFQLEKDTNATTSTATAAAASTEEPSKEMPEIRPLYFRVESPNECQEWCDSFSSDKFRSIQQERNELLELNRNMNEQMKEYVTMMEEEEMKRKEAEMETLQVRHFSQQMQSQTLFLVRQALEEKLSLEALVEMEKKHDTESGNMAIRTTAAPIGLAGGKSSLPVDLNPSKPFTNMLNMFTTSSQAKNTTTNNNNNNNNNNNMNTTPELFYQQMNEKRMEALTILQEISTASTANDLSTMESTAKAIETLVNYTSFLFLDRMKVQNELSNTHQRLQHAQSKFHSLQQMQQQQPSSKLDALSQKLEQVKIDRRQQIARANTLETQLHKSQHDNEMALYQLKMKQYNELQQFHTSMKERIDALEDHKELLKKEVLHLRKYNINTNHRTIAPSLSSPSIKIHKSMSTNSMNVVDRRTDMEDRNFGLPELSPLDLNGIDEALRSGPPSSPTSSSMYSQSGQSGGRSTSVPPNIGRDSSFDHIINGGNDNQDDIAVNSTSFETTESKDELFQQLRNIKHNNKKWYSKAAGCGELPMELTSSSSANPKKNKASQLSVFDSSTWLCGQTLPTDDFSL